MHHFFLHEQWPLGLSTPPACKPLTRLRAAELRGRRKGEKKKWVVMSAGRRESPIRMRTAGPPANGGTGRGGRGDLGGGAGGVVTLAGERGGGSGWAERAVKFKRVVTPEGSVASSHSNVAKRSISGETERFSSPAHSVSPRAKAEHTQTHLNTFVQHSCLFYRDVESSFDFLTFVLCRLLVDSIRTAAIVLKWQETEISTPHEKIPNV